MLLAGVVGSMLLMGLSPFDDDSGDGAVAGSVVATVNVAFAPSPTSRTNADRT